MSAADEAQRVTMTRISGEELLRQMRSSPGSPTGSSAQRAAAALGDLTAAS